MSKKIISLALCILLVFAVGTISFAAEDTEKKTVNTQTEVTEEVKTEEKAEDAPATDAPATDVPVTDVPATDVPVTDVPVTDVPVTEPIKLVVTDSNLPVQVNGVAVSFEDVGLKKVTVGAGDITLVPIRKIAEMLNCTVAWRNSDRTVHIFKNGKSVVLAINNPIIKIYDFEVGAKFVYTSEAEEKFVYAENKGVTPVIEIEIDESGKEIARTLVPLRAISECLNATVNYDGEAQLITINDNDSSMLTYKPSISDMKARNMIENYNYKPVVELKSCSIVVKVVGNFEGATPEIGDGVIVTVDGKTQTAANGGTCTFTEMKSGTYTITVSNVPEGYSLQTVETTVTVEGGETNVNVYLVKAETSAENK